MMLDGCRGYSIRTTDCVLFQMEQMFSAFPLDVSGNLDYCNLVHVITHGEEKDQE